MTIRTDQRTIHAEADHEAAQAIAADFRALLDLRIGLAHRLVAFWRKAAYYHETCTSIEEFAGRHHGSPSEAKTLLHAGFAFESMPTLEEKVREGKVPLESAAAIGRLVVRDALEPGDDWVTRAMMSHRRDIERAVKQRLAEKDQETVGVTEVQVFVPEQTKEDFGRCRQIASQQAGKPLSDEQTFQRVVGHFLDSFDPLRREARARRLGPTEEIPGSRYVPREVVREILRRSGGMCEIPGCHRRGSSSATSARTVGGRGAKPATSSWPVVRTTCSTTRGSSTTQGGRQATCRGRPSGRGRGRS